MNKPHDQSTISERRFPIIGTKEDIPWRLISRHERQALRNHNQTLERLAARGGLSWEEALLVLTDAPLEARHFGNPDPTARGKVLAIVRNNVNG